MKKDILQTIRKIRYRLLSKMEIVSGNPEIRQPALFCGKGKIIFEGRVCVGYYPSPLFFCGYCHFEARIPEATIRIGDGTYINNNCVIISEGPGIDIGKNCFIGSEVHIYDSDFHGVTNRSDPSKGTVSIGDDVFIGARTIILKGVHVGSHSTIGAGSVVTGRVPPNTIVAGNPAKTIRVLE